MVDAAGVTQSNIAEERRDRALSIYDVRLHVLASGHALDLEKRRPSHAPDLQQSQRLEQDALAQDDAA